eukprot:TRINITY_DN50063_c0_g1_i1.p1 TRINITY_DN50063_c0_g1~~TRINITY_DN50063_c0_g1_i1.p1  ORF type:complete len:346 (-),score=8.12 TRINITY_DN50063_c0_g1_i1:201-1238(-)
MPDCSSVFTRWRERDCYCPEGDFYQTAAGPPCTRDRLDGWLVCYIVYSALGVVTFSIMCFWCASRVLILRHNSSRMHQFKAHSICFVAMVLRIGYVASEAIAVHAVRSNIFTSDFWPDLAATTYSSFFAFCAAAFGCICEFWLGLIHVIDEAPAIPAFWNRFHVAWIAILILEGVRLIFHLFFGEHYVYDAVYTIYLGILCITFSFVGARIAFRLYKRLRIWIADENSLFKTVFVSSAGASLIAITCFVLNLVWCLWARFSAWPCLMCWFVCRVFEALYIYLILIAGGPVQRERTINEELPDAGDSFSSSQHTGESFEVAAGGESFRIGSIGHHSSRTNVRSGLS